MPGHKVAAFQRAEANFFEHIQGVFLLVLPLKVLSTKKLILARLGVSKTIYVNVDSPNLGFRYFNLSPCIIIINVAAMKGVSTFSWKLLLPLPLCVTSFTKSL